MKVLVTGGAGFIGSHIVDALLEKGHEVRVLDNLSTGSLNNLDRVKESIEFTEGDIRDATVVHTAVKGMDSIVHAAAQASVQKSIENPGEDAEINTLGTEKIAEAARVENVKKIVYLSTAAVYGNPDTVPIAESQKIEPLSPYGKSKHAGELVLEKYHTQYQLDYAVLRLANVYGPRQDPRGEAGVISIFMDNALSEKPLIIYGDGMQTRDFVYVKDVAAAVVAALEKETPSRVYNIGTGMETLIHQLVEMMKEQAGDSVQVKTAGARPGDIKHSCLDVSKAKEEFGFSAKTSMREGLLKTMEWFKAK